MYVNEIQRSINGFGACNYNERNCVGSGCIVPYGHWRDYKPTDVTRGLGDVPNDFEASVDLQYIPVRQGWYYGYPVDGGSYPDYWHKGNLGQTPPITPAPAAVPQDAQALDKLARTQRTQTILQVISTASIAAMAVLAITKAIVESRRG